MAYYREILERVKTVPGMKAAAIVNNLPLSGVNSPSANSAFTGPDGQSELMSARTISPQYFAAMGIPLIAGRDFCGYRSGRRSRRGDHQRVPGAPTLPRPKSAGRKARRADRTRHGPTIVGVVKDSSQMSYELPAKGEVYIPYQQFIFGDVHVDHRGAHGGRTDWRSPRRCKKQVWAVDPNQPVVKVETMDDVIANSIWRPRFSAWIFSVLADWRCC